eukprot:4382763-Amphidinium_carterae.1
MAYTANGDVHTFAWHHGVPLRSTLQMTALLLAWTLLLGYHIAAHGFACVHDAATDYVSAETRMNLSIVLEKNQGSVAPRDVSLPVLLGNPRTQGESL